MSLLSATSLLAAAASAALIIGLLAATVSAVILQWKHWRRRKQVFAGELLNAPGAVMRWHQRRLQRRSMLIVLALSAAIGGALTSSVAPLPLTDLTLPIWAMWTICAASMLFLSALLIEGIRSSRHSARLGDAARYHDIVAQNLSRVSGEYNRLFNDVIIDRPDQPRLDHVLLGVQGAFAIVVIAEPAREDCVATINGQHLQFADKGAVIDLGAIRQRVTQLQHQLSKALGRMIRLRTVIAIPGWRCDQNTTDDLLIVGHSDIVMLQGWRNAADGLLTEDTTTLQRALAERCRQVDPVWPSLASQSLRIARAAP